MELPERYTRECRDEREALTSTLKHCIGPSNQRVSSGSSAVLDVLPSPTTTILDVNELSDRTRWKL